MLDLACSASGRTARIKINKRNIKNKNKRSGLLYDDVGQWVNYYPAYKRLLSVIFIESRTRYRYMLRTTFGHLIPILTRTSLNWAVSNYPHFAILSDNQNSNCHIEKDALPRFYQNMYSFYWYFENWKLLSLVAPQVAVTASQCQELEKIFRFPTGIINANVCKAETLFTGLWHGKLS